MTMITPSYLGETIEYSSLHACRSTLEDPTFFLFDPNGKLVYRGQFDDSRPANSVPTTGADLRAAADAVLEGRTPSAIQKASIGCNIKWKIGNEPEYFAANYANFTN